MHLSQLKQSYEVAQGALISFLPIGAGGTKGLLEIYTMI